jgi:peptidyl-prolyl cis-trans isomerase D
MLKEKRKEGVPAVADIKEKLTQDCRNDKKADMIKANISKAKASDITALATAMSATVATAEGVSYRSPQVGEVSEPNFAAALSGCAQGKMTQPVSGATGVFVGVASAVTPAAAVQDYQGPKGRMAQMERSKVEFGVFGALEKAASITDNVAKFF